MKPTSVTVTAVGSTTAQSVIKALRHQREIPVEITGTDTHSKSEIAGSAACDNFVRVPPCTPVDSYIRALRRVKRVHGMQLLVPIHDSELQVVSQFRETLRRNCLVLVSSLRTVRICNDKWRAFKEFTKLGLPTFSTIRASRIVTLSKAIEAAGLKYPLIAKPRSGIGAVGVYEITDDMDLPLVRRIHDPIIQELGRGEEFTIDTFSDSRGCVVAIPRLRIETRAGISYRGEIVRDQALQDLARSIVNHLRVFGPANVQVIRDAQSGTRILEVNPRFSGGLPLTTASGVNTPLLALRLAVKGSVGVVPQPVSVSMCRRWEETFYYAD